MNTQSTALAVGEGARAADSAVPSVNPAINGPVAVNRRRFVLGASSALALGALPRTVFAGQAPQTRSPPAVLTGNRFDLHIGKQTVNFTGAERIATTVNNMLPGPILRWKEGDRVTLRVTNHLNEDSSIHWHGLILPSEMDGVPHMSFPGIKPGETFEYQFDVKQNGTYWYHSHSSFQEQTGLLGSIIIEPKEPDPVSYDRDFIVMLSDWSDESPHHIYHTLKKMSHYYNFRERTAGDLLGDLKEKGFVKTWRERAMWNQMRMSETDIADVTGYTYTYLMNGDTPDRGWVGLFKPGEKVRLRFINGAAMSIFDVRIPGLKMTVVAADGQNIQPVIVDEFRIGVAETYDVVVEPEGDRAYTVFAQTNDRTGYARGTLTPDVQLQAEIPAMDPAPVLGHREMGMDMTGMDHAGHDMSAAEASDSGAHSQHSAKTSDHTGHSMNHERAMSHGGDHQNHGNHASNPHQNHDMSNTKAMDHGSHGAGSAGKVDHSNHLNHGQNHADHHGQGTQGDHSASDAGEHHHNHGKPETKAHVGHSESARADRTDTSQPAEKSARLAKAGFGSNFDAQGRVTHFKTEYGPHVDNRSEAPQSGLADPGIGLRDHQRLYGRRVLTYADIKGLHPTYDKREPSREIELHLTGNMRRYMWSINGQSFADAKPLELTYGERVRIILVNDTMMTHPVHLHGMWSELETGDPDYIPRKHTVIVQPGAKVSYLVTADALGRWAYHCHLLYHMPGMMREVRVVRGEAT